MSSAYPPFAVWRAWDHSGPVIIVTTLSLFYWLALGIIQNGIVLAHNMRLTLAEGIFILSMVVGIGQSSLLLRACHYGFGKSATHLQPEEVDEAENYYYISTILYVLTLGLIKSSASLFVIKLTVNNFGSLRQASRDRRFIFYMISVLIAAWTVSSMVVLTLPCGGSDKCTGTMTRWRGIVAGDAATDILIAIFAAHIIWRTQASLRSKFLWYIPFTVRLCVPLIAGLRLLTISPTKLTSDPTFSLWLFAILGQLQIFVSMMGGTSPALKKTMVDLSTNFGAATDSQSNSKQRSGYKAGGGSYAMRYLQNGSQKSNSEKTFAPFVGSSSVNHVVSGRRASEEGDGESESQKGIMRRDEIELSYESNRNRSSVSERWI